MSIFGDAAWVKPLPLVRTEPMACPYLPGRLEQRLVTLLPPGEPGTPREFDTLTRAGFRRSQHYAYRPACPSCHACVPCRIPIAAFVPNASQRRCVRRNADLVTNLSPALATREHYALFRRYEAERHGDGDMARMRYPHYRAMIEASAVDTMLVEHRRHDGRLMAVALVDRLGDGLSAVYSFFEPGEAQRGLGVWCVLDLVRRARMAQLPHVYLGYWIRDCRKMSYKTLFRPLEMLTADGWRVFEPDGA